LLSSGRKLISDEITPGYDGGLDFAFDKSFDSVLPSLIESDTINVLQDVNSSRRLADLEGTPIHKVSWS
jgi:hypothetical protein